MYFTKWQPIYRYFLDGGTGTRAPEYGHREKERGGFGKCGCRRLTSKRPPEGGFWRQFFYKNSFSPSFRGPRVTDGRQDADMAPPGCETLSGGSGRGSGIATLPASGWRPPEMSGSSAAALNGDRAFRTTCEGGSRICRYFEAGRSSLTLLTQEGGVSGRTFRPKTPPFP